MEKHATLIIGASENPKRYAHKAIKKLRAHDHKVHAIGLREGKVDDVKIITEKKDFKDIDTVSLYLNPKRQEEYYDYIIRLHPRRVVFNPGTENEDFYALLKEKAIHCEVACTLVLLSTNQY